MMEVSNSSAVSTSNTVSVVQFTLGAADSTPTATGQSISFNMTWGSTTYPGYIYTFKVGYSSTRLYFDDVYYVRLNDTSTASSVLFTTGYTLFIGRVWRLVL